MIKERKYMVSYFPSKNFIKGKGFFIRINKIDKWNDFRFKTHAEFNVITDDDVKAKFHVKIAVSTIMMNKNHDSNLDYESFIGLGNVLDSLNNDGKEFKLSGGLIFFSMLNSLEDYKKLISIFGVHESHNILKSMNDIVYLNEFRTEINDDSISQYVNEFLNSSAFNLSFIRNSEGYFAFRNAGDVIRGLDNESLSYISNKLVLTFKLDCFNNEHEVSLNYNPNGLIPKRINILIGENGLGKSQTINHFIKAAANIRGGSHKMVDPQNLSGRPVINRIRAFVMPGEVSGTYPNQHANLKIDYKKIYVGKGGYQQERQLKDALVSLARDNTLIGNRTMFDVLCMSLDKVIPVKTIFISLSDDTKIPLWKLDGSLGEEMMLRTWERIVDDVSPLICSNNDYYPLSSGQLVYFKFALLALSNIANGTFVIIDEPETHLHPSFISGFISLLDDILERTGSLALIATHSPYLVREVTREQVHVFKCDAGYVHITPPRLKTFGANISDISDFVFDDNIQNKLSEKLIKNAMGNNKTYQQLKTELYEELPVEMLHHIKNELK